MSDRILNAMRTLCFFILAAPPGVSADHTQTAAPLRSTKGSETEIHSQTQVSIEDCIHRALQQNRQLSHAQLNSKIAEQLVGEAWGEVFPTIDWSASYGRNFAVQEIFFPDFSDPTGESIIPIRIGGDNTWNTTLTLEQPLFKAQALIGLGAASQFKNLQSERVRGTTHQVVREVRTHYYSVLLATERIRLTQSSLDRVESTLSGAKELQKAGLGNSYDVLRLEVEMSRLKPVLRRAFNDRAEAERLLKVRMGLSVRQPITLAGSLQTINLENLSQNSEKNRALLAIKGINVQGPADLENTLQRGRQDRSSLRQARLDTFLAKAQLSSEKASLYPRLLAFANYQINAQEDGSLNFFGENEFQRTTTWQAGIRLEIPILQGGARYHRISKRRLQVKQRQTMEQLLEDEAIHDIQTRFAQLLEARDRVTSQNHAVAQAKRGFEIASTEFRAGVGTQFNALDAEVVLRETEFNYAEAVFEVLRTQALLDEAVGAMPVIDKFEESP